MTVRGIRSIGDPVLRETARPLDPSAVGSEATQQLIEDLIDTMHHANGAGLAANQVGEPVRIAVMEVTDNPRYPYKPQLPLTVAINPVIEPLSDELLEINEGCLSVPLRGSVLRHVDIRVRYLDRDGVAHDTVEHGLTAGTWQHEVDHLDGTLFIDRVEDPTTLATWAEFEAHHREAFLERIAAFANRQKLSE
ncbi:MAG: peptide deformylase [Acidimicrobiales bacterium]